MGGKQSAVDASMPKSGRGRKAGKPVTEAQRAANEKARKAAAESKRIAKAKRDELREDPEYKPRWKQLEDGDIDVSDLSAKELRMRACANNDGTWTGKRHPLPSRIINRMEAEKVKRDRREMARLTRKGFKALEERLDDSDAPAQQLTAALRVIEYSIGKVPEVVHIGAETAYDRLQQSAFIVKRGGDLQEELEGLSADGALDNTGHDVVSGELGASDG